jgi:hypothetical protein
MKAQRTDSIEQWLICNTQPPFEGSEALKPHSSDYNKPRGVGADPPYEDQILYGIYEADFYNTKDTPLEGSGFPAGNMT